MSKLQTCELLALACKALTERYSEDPSAPGILVSHIAEGPARVEHIWVNGMPNAVAHSGGPTWYVAVHRYKGSFGASREVAHKVYNADLDEALVTLIRLAAPAYTAQRDLAVALKAVG